MQRGLFIFTACPHQITHPVLLKAVKPRGIQERDSWVMSTSDSQTAFILIEGRTVTQRSLPLPLSSNQCFSVSFSFLFFLAQCRCFVTLLRKNTSKSRWHLHNLKPALLGTNCKSCLIGNQKEYSFSLSSFLWEYSGALILNLPFCRQCKSDPLFLLQTLCQTL